MKILVTGADGQLGRELVQILSERHQVIGCNRKALDITDTVQCREAIGSVSPDAVVHAAAYTQVDAAETDAETAYRVNAAGTRNAAAAAERGGAVFCYISSDYVFDGTSTTPYREYDAPNPQSVYGKTKLAGEQWVRTTGHRHFIVRTSWLFGQYGNNFVKTILRLAQQKEQIRVVHDQVGSPTYAADLSHFVTELLQTEKYGTYHASNAGSCSWYEFAQAVVEGGGYAGAEVVPCLSEDLKRPAPRPAYSVLDPLALRAEGFTGFRHWRDALRAYLLRAEGRQMQDRRKALALSRASAIFKR